MRSRSVLAVGISLLTMGGMLAACTDSGDSMGSAAKSSPSQHVSGVNPNAELDPDNAVVHLPADYVNTTFREYDSLLINDASGGAFVKCVDKKLGIKLKGYPLSPYEPTYEMFWRYGPWTKKVAEKFAFVTPMSNRDLIENGYVPRPEGDSERPTLNPFVVVPAEDRAKMDEACSSDQDSQKFALTEASSEPGAVALEDTWDQADSDPEMQKLLDELDICFQGEGMKADPQRIGYPTAAVNTVINEEQVGLALKTVECKNQIDFTQRVADILAKYQMKVIDKHSNELFATRKKWDDLVAEAETYIAANPEYFVQVGAN